MQLLHHLCLSGASAPPLTRNSNTGETVPADVSLQSGESHVALHLKWLISDQVMTVVERSCQAALEKMLQLNPRVATVVSALKIELPGPAAIPVVSPPREVPESTAMLLSLLAHCARAHRATDTPSASSPPSPISAQVRMRLASSNKLQSALLALLRALMPSLEDDQPEDVGAGGAENR